MKEKKSCVSAFLSCLMFFAAIAAIACVIYKKFMKKDPQTEESDLLDADETFEDTDIEDLSEIDGEEG